MFFLFISKWHWKSVKIFEDVYRDISRHGAAAKLHGGEPTLRDVYRAPWLSRGWGQCERPTARAPLSPPASIAPHFNSPARLYFYYSRKCLAFKWSSWLLFAKFGSVPSDVMQWSLTLLHRGLRCKIQNVTRHSNWLYTRGKRDGTINMAEVFWRFDLENNGATLDIGKAKPEPGNR